MPAVVEARSMLCVVPLDTARGESKGVWLQRASRLLGVEPAKGKRLYYGELKRIDADTFARMKRRHAEILSLNQRIETLKAAERRHRTEANEIRRDLEMGKPGRPVVRRPAEQRGDQAAPGSGVVPRSTD